MSASENDMSDSSNLGSPLSQMESGYGSPSQQVPQLTTDLTELSCVDRSYKKAPRNGPYLRIIEQPQNHFRFRYRSEMVGTHGCLLGKSYATNRTKTHPTVELVNYNRRAVIRCRLAQHDKPDEHPHKLLEDEQDRDVSYEVPEHGSFKVGFAGMGIIHTAKKDVPALLFNKYRETADTSQELKELKTRCEEIAKNIKLDIVRLKFTAHDVQTNHEICDPVFSEPIYNMKSSATNVLKICRISRCFGRPKGGDDVFILVEKVNKKNINIRFYEVDEDGEECWTAKGEFLPGDVHHQYAIVFRTPSYHNTQITSDVKVRIELVRPSDGQRSDYKEFTYKADLAVIQSKKRKANSSYSSLESGGSIKSISDLPAPVVFINQINPGTDGDDVIMFTAPQIPQVNTVTYTTSNNALSEVLYEDLTSSVQQSSPVGMIPASPLLSQSSAPGPPVLQLDSAEFQKILQCNPNIVNDEKLMSGVEWPGEFMTPEVMAEYFEDHVLQTNFFPTNNKMKYQSDSGRSKAVAKGPIAHSSSTNMPPPPVPPPKNEIKKQHASAKPSENMEYTAYYTAKDGEEVKKLLKDLCDMMKHKHGLKKQVVQAKLERLFEMRLSNGDTFLHMTLSSNQPSLDYIVKLIHSARMTHLLNLTNNRNETILHLAIFNDMPKLVSFLVSKGCDPMIEDQDGNNMFHLAVIFQSCLETLLDAVKYYKVACDLNATNNEKQTALHLAAVYGSEVSTRALLRQGASYNVRDMEGRTPLHLAAFDDCLYVVNVLLDAMAENDIDAVDGHGNTALQIVCGRGLKENSLAIVRHLLQKKADPMKHEDNDSAWKLARDKPEIREIMKKYVPAEALYEDDVKSEPEDDFESADEGEAPEVGLSDLSLYLREVSALVDATGAWRELAKRLQVDSLLNWFAGNPSPTQTILKHIKECNENISSKSLAFILDDMGQAEAANVIRQYISD